MTALQPDASTRAVLRQFVATLAYRAAKVLRDAPPDFRHRTLTQSTRAPVQIVAHLGDLMAWAVRLAQGEYVWQAAGSDDWETEVARFFDGLATLDELLAAGDSLGGALDRPVEKLIQGPLADALTHVGQLAILRGMAGAPIRPESYAQAVIVAGRVGRDQSPGVAEFDGDASARPR